ncbi:MAG: bifunctional nuclease family protein [Flavobacteriales bacterium]
MQAGAYALLLEEESGQIKLPIIIGGLEARSIATALEKNTKPPRPFTHDLFVNFSKAFHIQIKSIVIYKLTDGIFSSYIIFEGIDGEKRIDSRTSDAIALAIRCEAPIYTTREIFDQAGIYLENIAPLEQKKTTTESPTQEIQVILHKEGQDLQKMSSKHLEMLLTQAIDREHYELAAHIQKELDRRKL